MLVFVLAEGLFSWYSSFSPSRKPQHSQIPNFAGLIFLWTGFHNGQLGKRKTFTVSMVHAFFVQLLLFIFECASC